MRVFQQITHILYLYDRVFLEINCEDRKLGVIKFTQSAINVPQHSGNRMCE